MTGSLPSAPFIPLIVIGRSAVPRAAISSFSRYGSLRQWIRTASPGASDIQGTADSDSHALPGTTSYVVAPALLPSNTTDSKINVLLIMQSPSRVHYALSRQQSPRTTTARWSKERPDSPLDSVLRLLRPPVRAGRPPGP